MSERPRFKDDIGNVSYRSGWNACIDAYEQWEKDNPRLKKLDREKVAAELFIIKKGDHAPESEQIMIMEECYREASFICAKFGQPKDAVSVEEIENTIRKCSEHNHVNATWAAKEVHALINRKLKGQDNEAK